VTKKWVEQGRTKDISFNGFETSCRLHFARAFLHQYSIFERGIDIVGTAIARHTTPGIPQYMHPVVAVLTTGVEMDVLGIGYSDFAEADREAVVDVPTRESEFPALGAFSYHPSAAIRSR
jgi:hypothetical protein